MTNPISATWQDIRLNDIRNAVRSKTGTVPYLLMPVRIETRFMKVQVNTTASVVSVPDVLNQVALLQVKLIDLKQAPAVVPKDITQLSNDLGKLNKAIQQTTVSIKEKGWLKTLFTEIKTDCDQLLKKNRLAADSLQNPLNELQKTIDSLRVQLSTLKDPVQDMLENLRAVQAKIVSLNDRKKTPFINVKNKKDLYVFTKQSISEAVSTLQESVKAVTDLKEIFVTQTNRIAIISKDLREQTAKLTVSLRGIHKDQKWQSFVAETSTTLVTALVNQISAFERTTLPKLKALPQPKASLDEKDILFHGIQTLTYLKRFNAGGTPAKFTETKILQTRLASRVATLEKAMTANMKFSPGVAAPVGDIYRQIKSQLGSSVQQVNKFAAKNKSQVSGKNTILNFIGTRAIKSVDLVVNSPAVTVTPATETRNELWVRIFPDDIFVQTHEESLSEKEVSAGKIFWKGWWASSGNADLELVSFRNLAKGFGIRRAAWICRSLDPRLLADNVAALKNKPSVNVPEAIKIIDEVYSLLQALTKSALDKTPQQVIGSIQPPAFDSYTLQISRVNTKLATVLFESTFVMQHMQSSITKLAAAINILIDKRNLLTPDTGNLLTPQLEALGKLGTEFEKVIALLNKIEVLPFDTFLRRLGEPFKYPAVATKTADWTTAPHSNCLPDQFVVVTVQNNVFTHIAVGEKIPGDLQLGLNPLLADNNAFHLDANGDLHVDEKLLWMTEYSEALKAGMAITVPLTTAQANEGFDQVFVIGVKNAAPPVGQQLLGSLLQNHIYATDGMAFLKVGTPTNNTQKDKSGYNPDKDLEKIFNIEINQQKPVSRKYIGDTDAQRLEKSLGLPPNSLSKAVDFQNTTVSDALVMNRALWNSTMGHYMEEMWDGIFTYDNIFRTEKFFLDNVVARGFLPSIRVGEQPYGILPTTAFSQLELYPGLTFPNLTVAEMKTANPATLETKLQQRFDIRLKQILDELQNEWKTFPVVHADTLDQGGAADSHQKNYMNMVGLHATSMNYHVRYAVNVGKGPEMDSTKPQSVATNFSSTDKFGPQGIFQKFKELMHQGIYTKSFYLFSEENPVIYAPFQLVDSKYNEVFTNLQKSRIFIARFMERQPELKGKTVERLPVSDSLLSNNYIQWLLSSNPDQLLASNNWANLPDKTLLFMLLRQSLMQAYQEAALSILQAENLVSERSRRAVGNTDNYYSFDTKKGRRLFSTKWHYLLKNLNDMEGFGLLDKNGPFYNYLLTNSASRPSMSRYVYFNSDSMLKNPLFINYSNKANHQKFLAKVDEVRDAFKTLATFSTRDLDTLFAEHIDLCTYRLDAWQLGFVNRRLRQHRLASTNGINLGAFGWVENLRPDTNRIIKPAGQISSRLTPVNKAPVHEDPDNEGFIHGPSISHGIAAAILRAGYLSDRKSAGAGSRLSINLSSERIRQALSLMNGIQNGLDIGAVLGFQLERGLHERYQLGVELDKYIQPLRKQYPLVEEIKDTADGNKPAYQPHVINGKSLLDEVLTAVDWHNNNSEKTLETILTENNFIKCPAFILSLTSIPAERIAIIKEIDRMADALDSLGDLVMSEGVYQIVKGNHVRAAAVMSSVSPNQKTATTIPMPEIIDTPRAGTIVTQRVILSLPNKTAIEQPLGWLNADKTFRAKAEPALNYWLGTILGKAADITCEVSVTPKGGTRQSLFISVDYLKWQPIDYFFFGIDETVLINQITWKVRKIENLADDTTVLPLLKSKTTGRSFYEMDWLMAQVRQLLNSAKSVGNHDLLSTDQQDSDPLNPGLYNGDQFLLRAHEALKSLRDVVAVITGIPILKNVIDGKQIIEEAVLAADEVKKLLDTLDQLSLFGIANLIPGSKNPGQKAWPALIRQILAGYKEASGRITDANTALDPVTATTTSQIKVEQSTLAFKAIFGKAFLALPQFQVSNFSTIKAQIDNPTDVTKGILRNDKGLVMEKWLQSIARVREKMYAVEMLSFGVESLRSENLNILPAQLSYKEGDFWLGIEYPKDHVPNGDKLSLDIINPGNLGSTSTAILIDDWVEIIPGQAETSGLAFNYNQPNAMPPQSLLLAVNPHDTANWNWDDLVYTLRDTLALSKQRAVEPDHIEKSRYSLVLPAIVAEVVPPEVQDDDGNALGVQLALDFINNS